MKLNPPGGGGGRQCKKSIPDKGIPGESNMMQWLEARALRDYKYEYGRGVGCKQGSGKRVLEK